VTDLIVILHHFQVTNCYPRDTEHPLNDTYSNWRDSNRSVPVHWWCQL